MDKDTIITLIAGEVTAITAGIISFGKGQLISILLFGTALDYTFLCVKTLALGALGGFGSLIAKALWEKITLKK